MAAGIDTGMKTTFFAYLLKAIPTADLLEITELFPKEKINDLFTKEIDHLIRQRHTPRFSLWKWCCLRGAGQMAMPRKKVRTSPKSDSI